jgi:cytochrome c oxidase subunit 3
MSTENLALHKPHDDPAGHAGHPAHLAHHFDTMGQQFDAGKLGMWVFLATEILMFGGLFCAYSVYRANNPDVFAFAHRELNTTLGAINTVILIASSLTMAWAVRCAQLGQKKQLCLCLALSILGGLGFMCIKTIEYTTKYQHHLWVGPANEYHPKYTGEKHGEGEHKAQEKAKPAEAPAGPVAAPDAPTVDRSATAPPAKGPQGVNPGILAGDDKAEAHPAHAAIHFEDLPTFDKNRTHIFFQIYFLMTGLHGLHVLIGMGLMVWLLVRAAKGTFGPHYFIPVDLVGLYWHVVDLIWIFLFPLLYLIH